jgi:predicted metal-dependent peptidase
MTSPYTPAHLAAGAIKRGILRLAGRYPFHARVLERFRPVASPPVGTMGVTASGEGVKLLYNPDFVLGLPADQLGGVLLHEVHHVAFGHLTLDPKRYPDRRALTVALEVTVNEFVREPLPPGGILLDQFPGLPPMESSDQRYRRLEQSGDRPAAAPGPAAAGTGNAGGEGTDVPGTLDNHAVWAEALQDPRATGQMLADLLQQAAMEAGGMPRELADALARTPGTTAGQGVHFLQGDRDGRLDWKRLLRGYAGRVLRVRPVFHRPPRRFPDLLGILPGRRRLADRAAVVAVIDTSGSISDDCLEEIDGELARVAKSHPVHVVECDCAVHRVYRYRRRLEHVEGRGGTDFRPALEPDFLRRLRPQLVVYFTDGQGEAPARPPPWPSVK